MVTPGQSYDVYYEALPAAWGNLSVREVKRYLESVVNFERSGLNNPLWQADHVQAVMHGGGACEKGNFQTLCVSCHKLKTAQDMKRNARRT